MIFPYVSFVVLGILVGKPDQRYEQGCAGSRRARAAARIKSLAAATNLGICMFVMKSLLGALKPSPARLALGAAQLATDLDCTVAVRSLRLILSTESEVLRLLSVTA